MNIPADFSPGKRLFKWSSLFPLFIMLFILLISCKGRPEPYSIIEFTGKGVIYNYSKLQFPLMYETDSANSTAFLASRGDVIACDDYCCFVYSGGNRNKFSITIANNITSVNDKLNSIHIPSNDGMIPWFGNIKTIDISDLGFLYFDSIVPEGYLPYLKDLSKSKPNIGIGYDGTIKEMSKLFEMFKPGFIVGACLSQSDYEFLPGLTNLGFLAVYLTDSLYTKPLPGMPGLKQLFLNDVKENVITSEDFLINNKQLEKLTIMGSGNINLSLIKPLDNLKELIINGYDSLLNFDLILDHKKLELLSLSVEKSGNIKKLDELPGIRWMNFYTGDTQDGFDAFIGSHPDLEVVELIYNDTINNLQPLSNLKKLYGLTVTDSLADVSFIKTLSGLKYLSLSHEILDDSRVKEGLLKALPATVIVPNEGVCLGSGWLLLIIPVIAGLSVFSGRKSR
jgi:hypothetical protein